MGLVIGRYPDNEIDLGETCDTDGENCVDNAIIGTQPEFFGVIDSDGFAAFEFRELEGTIDDAKYIFTDDLHIGLSGVASAVQSWELYD